MLTGAIVEDNSLIRIQLVQLLTATGLIKIIFSKETGEDFFTAIHSCTPEVVFLDIDLPGMSGVEVARKLRSTHTDIEIVFITSYTDFRSDAIELYAADYITKPINATRLIRTLQRVTERFSRKQRVLEIPVGDNIELIREQDICFIEARGHKAVIYTEAGVIEEAKHSLKEMEEMVSKTIFFRTSRFCLVNVHKVSGIRPLTASSFELVFDVAGYKAQLSRKMYESFRLVVKNLSSSRGAECK